MPLGRSPRGNHANTCRVEGESMTARRQRLASNPNKCEKWIMYSGSSGAGLECTKSSSASANREDVRYVAGRTLGIRRGENCYPRKRTSVELETRAEVDDSLLGRMTTTIWHAQSCSKSSKGKNGGPTRSGKAALSGLEGDVRDIGDDGEQQQRQIRRRESRPPTITT